MNKYLAELVGTFVLVFGGLGSAVLAGDKIGYQGVALAFGLSLLAMVYTIGPISGCHINPAVTLGALISKKISGGAAAVYMAAQVLGAACAAALILIIVEGTAVGAKVAATGLAANGYGTHSPGQYPLPAAFITEAVLTMFLVFTVLGSTDLKAPVGFAGIAIGLVLTLIHLVGIPVTNASVNPARSIASAIFTGGWALQQLWLFIVAPLSGAVVAAGIYAAVRVRAVVITTTVAERSLLGEQKDRSSRPAA
jgi:aquaporin Z